MSDKDKQPLAASASAQPEAETADAALQHIVDGFLHFHHEIFPQQEELFKNSPRPSGLGRCSSRAPIRALFPS